MALNFSEENDIALVWSSDGKAGFIDKDGKYLINPQFEEGTDFYGDIAFVQSADKWGIINKEGKYLVICSLYFKPDISKDVITFYCKSVCEKSFTGYPDIDYNRTIIRGYKNGDLIEEYSPLTEKSEKVNDEARWREWKKEKYGEMGASSVSDYEAQKQWHRDYRAGKSVPLPSPERRKEIDKMIEDIFR